MRPLLKMTGLLLALTGFPAGQEALHFSDRIVHNPPVAVLNDRPFIFDLVVGLDVETIEKVALFWRTDSSETYRERELAGEFGLYQTTLTVDELIGETITYFFVVTLHDYSTHGTPVDSLGSITPIVRNLVNPEIEFFQRRYYE